MTIGRGDRLFAVMALAGAAACGRGPDASAARADSMAAAAAIPAATATAPPADTTPLGRAAARALAVDAEAEGYLRSDRSLDEGEAATALTILRKGTDVVVLEERRSLGDRGASVARYYLDEGRLVYYVEQGIRTETKDVGYPLTTEHRLEARIALDASGAVLGSHYAYDGADAPLPAAMLREVKARATRLLAEAAKGP